MRSTVTFCCSQGMELRRNESVELSHQHERAPATLYAYGGLIPRMLVLQFLTFYQVLEFYFYRYLKRKSEQRIRNLLEEEPFDRLGEADKFRLLEAIRLRYEGSKSRRADSNR